MKLKQVFWLLLPALITFSVSAETSSVRQQSGSTFHFSTQVSRTVEKEVMIAELSGRKSGKNLAELKKAVSKALNTVLDTAKKASEIDISADGIRHYVDYDNQGKVIGWIAEGRLQLKSKNFDAVAAILDNLGSEVAIEQVNFSVSPEKLAALEDEMTLEIIQQLEHKAKLIQKGLNATTYRLIDIQLNTPNSGQVPQYSPRMYEASMLKSAMSSETLPLEAGKQTIFATASGKAVFE